MKKIIYLIIFILTISTAISFFKIKRTIEFEGNDQNIIIKIPPILIAGWLKNFEIKVLNNATESYLNLLYSAFDRPLLFYPDKKNGIIFVMYFFDIEDHVFAIKLDGNKGKKNLSNINKSIKKIITSLNGFKVRYLTKEEIENVLNKLSSMSEEEYRKLSVPSLDLGFYKFYVPKSRVLEILQKDKKRFDVR